MYTQKHFLCFTSSSAILVIWCYATVCVAVSSCRTKNFSFFKKKKHFHNGSLALSLALALFSEDISPFVTHRVFLMRLCIIFYECLSQ